MAKSHVLSLVLATALALSAPNVAMTAPDAGRPVTEQARAAFRADMAKVDFGEVLDLIRQRFPADYQAFETEMLAKGSPRPEDQDWMRASTTDFIQGIDARLKPARAVAPDVAVVEMGRRKLALMQAARPLSPRLCYEYVEAKYPTIAALEPVHVALRVQIFALQAAEMRAGLAGEATPTPRAQPSREDVVALVGAFMANGGDMAWFKGLGARQPQTAYTDAQRCGFALAWQEAMVSQPADRAARLLVR